MKLKLLIVCAFLVLGGTTQAQKLKEKDIIGTWKLVIDVSEELEEEVADADSYLERVVIRAVKGMVTGIIEGIDIKFRFEKNNRLEILVEAMGVEETEKGEWWIDKDGFLQIENIDDNDDHVVFSSNDRWQMENDQLVNYEGRKRDNVYMVRVN